MEYNRTQIVVKTPMGDVLFDSETEANYYLHLRELEDKGEIRNIVIKPQFVLQPPFVYFGKKIEGMVYTPDFGYEVVKTGEKIFIEVKGIITPEFELRAKLWKYQNQDKRLLIIAWSKKTGWLPLDEYRKARKQIMKEELEARVLRKQQEQKEKEERAAKREADKIARQERLAKEKHDNAVNRLVTRKNELLSKDKLTKKERERLEQIDVLLDELGYGTDSN